MSGNKLRKTDGTVYNIREQQWQKRVQRNGIILFVLHEENKVILYQHLISYIVLYAYTYRM